MWQRLKKKSEADLRTLNEKEIQQKLYGHYFIPKTSVGSDDISEINLSTVTSPKSASATPLEQQRAMKTEPKIQTPSSWEHQNEDEEVHKPVEKSFSQSDFSFKTETARPVSKSPLYTQVTNTPSKANLVIQWKLVVFAIAGIFILGIVLNGIIRLKHRNAVKSESVAQVATERPTQSPIAEPIAEKKVSEPIRGTVKSSSESVPRVTASSVSRTESEHPQKRLRGGDTREVVISPVQPQKYYSIQICTYKQESDARKLVTRLEDVHLPAHYISMPGKPSENSRFYLVLVGRDVNYSDAEAHLSKFKQMPISHEFPDAYIRKNS